MVPVEEPAPGHDIDPGTEQSSEFFDEMDLIQQRSSRLELDEKIHIAGRSGVAPSDGAEDPDSACAPTVSNLEKFVTAVPECVEGDLHGFYCRCPR